ncbi:MAG: nucleotidyltransferase family protein [Desulfuromonadales bacterium]
MGQPKPLLPLGDSPIIHHSLFALHDGGVPEPIVVLGPGGKAIAEVLSATPAVLAWNPDADSEMIDSIRIGLDMIPTHVSGVLIALADSPLLRPETVAGLISRHRNHPGRILLPCHDGKGGHPPLIPRKILEEVRTASTLRDVIQKEPERIEHVAFDDAGILQDMDTPEDYRHVRNLYMRDKRQNSRPGRD